jgi:16S rRNA (uracil1498-N3)-methyltransferase
MIRLYVDSPLAAGTTVEATAGQAHYLNSVMRQRPGDAVHLFNGRDGEWAGQITAGARRKASFAVTALVRPQSPDADLWLMFGVLKRDATDLVVQKATELGVSALLPVICARTNSARLNLDRLRAIAIEAAEQCERLTIPALHEPQRLADLLAVWDPARRLAVAMERVPGPPPATEGALLVGPEGGFTRDELDVMRATPFIQPVSLGPRILRAETAALAGLTLLQARHWSFFSQPPAGEPEQNHVQSW